MDKVLKRRLIGASILIALAVIFVPMLLVDPDSVGDGEGNRIDVPPIPDSAREVRRIPLDPEAARVAEPERASPDARRETGRGQIPDADNGADPDRISPSDEIVLRPDLSAPEAAPDEAETPAETDSGAVTADTETTVAQRDSTDSPAPAEQDAGPPPETDREQPAESPEVSMGDWVVQVASFGSQDAANQVRARLEALGHAVARDEIVRGQSLLYRLRTGPYPSRAAAEHALAQITATVEGVEPIVREMDSELREGTEAGFAVQVGSFVSEDNADNETSRLDGLGFDSFRFSEEVGERLIWRVMVGPVSERADADALKSRLGEQAGVEGLVVSYP